MRILQIKKLAESIARHDELSGEYVEWLLYNFSRQELKLFTRLLSKAIKYNSVTASFAGELSDVNKRKIIAMFPDKKILFKRDDKNIVGGMRLEYGDFVLDYSVSGIVGRILNGIRESL